MLCSIGASSRPDVSFLVGRGVGRAFVCGCFSPRAGRRPSRRSSECSGRRTVKPTEPMEPPPPMNAAFRYQLPNGLTVVLQENHAATVVAFQAWVGVGSADEPPELAGIAHVFEHMLFKGTARRGVGQIAQEVEARGRRDQRLDLVRSDGLSPGAGAAASSTPGSTSWPTRCRTRRSIPAELERELKVVLEEVKQGEDNPSPRRHAGAVRHRLSAPSLSPAGDRLHQDGQVVHARAAARLLPPLLRRQQHHAGGRRRLRRASARRRRSPRRSARRQRGRGGRAPMRKEPRRSATRAKVDHAGRARGATSRVAFHIPGIHHDDTGALDVASIILGQGDSSRLTLRGQAAARSWSPTPTPTRTRRAIRGCWSPARRMPPDKLDAALDALARARSSASRHEDVSRRGAAQGQGDHRVRRGLSEGDGAGPGAQARLLRDGRRAALGYEDEYNAAGARGDAGELHARAARRYLTVENATVAVLVPDDEAGDARQARGARWPPRSRRACDARRGALGAAGRRRPDLDARRRGGARQAAVGRAPAGQARSVGGPGGDARGVDGRPALRGREHQRRQQPDRRRWSRAARAPAPATSWRTRSRRMAGSIGGFSGRNSFGMRVRAAVAPLGARPRDLRRLHPRSRRSPTTSWRRSGARCSRRSARRRTTSRPRRSACSRRRSTSSHPYRLDVLGTAAVGGGADAAAPRRLLQAPRRAVADDAGHRR